MAGARPGACSRAMRAVGAVLATGLIAGLAGCTGDAAPSPPPLETSASSPSPTEATGSPAPTLPPDARGTSVASAKEFASYFIDTVNHALHTGDTTALRSASQPHCKTCNAIARNAERIYESGGHVESAGLNLKTVTVATRDPKMVLLLGIDYPHERVVEPGKKDAVREPSRGSLTMYLTNAPQWQVQRLVVVE